MFFGGRYMLLGTAWPWLIYAEFTIFIELMFPNVKPFIFFLLYKSEVEFLVDQKKKVIHEDLQGAYFLR